MIRTSKKFDFDHVIVMVGVLSLIGFLIVSLVMAGEPSDQNVHEVAPLDHSKELGAMPSVKGHPLTSVIVTQCNLIVAIYLTMPDGRLLRIDPHTQLPWSQALALADQATRSERVEVSCNEVGEVGHERRDPL